MSYYEKHMIDCLAEVMEIEATQLSAAMPFADQGLDSLNGLRFARKLQDLLGKEIDPEWLFDHPSVRQLSQFFEAQFGTLALPATAR